jgi:hypothetical protein
MGGLAGRGEDPDAPIAIVKQPDAVDPRATNLRQQLKPLRTGERREHDRPVDQRTDLPFVQLRAECGFADLPPVGKVIVWPNFFVPSLHATRAGKPTAAGPERRQRRTAHQRAAS